MSLGAAVVLLAVAVLLGGIAAFAGEIGRRAMPALRAFAVVAAAAIALVHLLPEAIGSGGFITLLATAAGALIPSLLERVVHPHEDHAPHAPSTALAIGYAAVVVHQASEGAALATLARAGILSFGIVLAIAAHTIPLAMVVALRVLEAREGRSREHLQRATSVALLGVAGATAVGAAAGSLVEASKLAAVEPWILAAAAGLLLHALAHHGFERPKSGAERIEMSTAAIAGLGVALLGLESGSWDDVQSRWLRAAAIAILVLGILAKLRPRKAVDAISEPGGEAEPKSGHHEGSVAARHPSKIRSRDLD